ncbi:MAG: hypothetical protein Q8O91_09310 [Candidatus Aminicenantes bacterium]|nr:hypothetical protein [Candidatus Aminicenantes bacterium]
MIKNARQFRRFEKKLIQREKVDIARNIRLFEEMYKEAVRLGSFYPQDPLSGIEVDIEIAAVVNRVSESP